MSYLSRNRALSTLELSKAASAWAAIHARGLTYLAATCGVLRATLAALDGFPFASSFRALCRAMAIARPLAPFSLSTALKCSLVAYCLAYLVARSGRISARAAMMGAFKRSQWAPWILATWHAVASSSASILAPDAQKRQAMVQMARSNGPDAKAMCLECKTASMGIGIGFSFAMPLNNGGIPCISNYF